MRLKTATAPAATMVPAAEVRDRLVMDHVPLVKALAQRLVRRLPPQVEINELISVGVLGLIEAANRYKPSTGVPFDAFARRRVHGAMLDALRGMDWAPRSLRRLRRTVDDAIATLRHELGREPSEEEIAKSLDLSPAEYDEALESLRSLEVGAIRPLDAPTADGTPLLELCVDPGEGALAQLERQQLREHLARAIGVLPERERQVIALYYEQELTLAEIGRVIGVCESRVCQLRALAISRLRTFLRSSLGQTEAA